MHHLLADTILVIHALFVAFVVAGLFLIIAGGPLRWKWTRNLWFRLVHLLAIGIVVAQAWLGRICPLTRWETALREAARQHGYAGSFIQHWLRKFIFYDFPPWVFTAAYTMFGAIVLVTWILWPPRRKGRCE